LSAGSEYFKKLCGSDHFVGSNRNPSGEAERRGIAPELMIPRAESQVRPIGKVPKEFWVVVWCQAIGIAGGIPTQKEVVFVVDQMFGPTGKTSPKNPSLKDIVKDVVVRLRLVLEEGCSKKELEDLVIELEEAVKVRLKVANPKSIT